MCHGTSMNPQGWYIGPNGEFFFWVPLYLRPCSLITYTTLVIPGPWVDVSHSIHGWEWQKIINGNLSISWQHAVLEFQMHGYERTVKNHFCSSLLHTFLLYSTSFYPFTDIPLFYSFHHLVFNPLYIQQNPLYDCQGPLLFTRVSVEDPLILTCRFSKTWGDCIYVNWFQVAER